MVYITMKSLTLNSNAIYIS